MAERLMIACDNPNCNSVGEPEFVPGRDGPKRRGQKITGPYGWHQGAGWMIGCGPSYEYMACCDACVGPAIADLKRLAYEKENGRL